MALREYVRSNLAEALHLRDDDKTVVMIEKALVNWSAERVNEAYSCKKQKNVAAWDNPYYTDIYKHKFMALRNSILASEELRAAIVSKKYKPSEIPELKPWELEKDGRYAQTMEERIHLELRKELAKVENKNVEGFFTCRRCKSKRTTYYELQTRSADEPMTVFVSCLNCDNHWKM